MDHDDTNLSAVSPKGRWAQMWRVEGTESSWTDPSQVFNTHSCLLRTQKRNSNVRNQTQWHPPWSTDSRFPTGFLSRLHVQRVGWGQMKYSMDVIRLKLNPSHLVFLQYSILIRDVKSTWSSIRRTSFFPSGVSNRTETLICWPDWSGLCFFFLSLFWFSTFFVLITSQTSTKAHHEFNS